MEKMSENISGVLNTPENQTTPKSPVVTKKMGSFKLNLKPRELQEMKLVSLTPCSSDNYSNMSSPLTSFSANVTTASFSTNVTPTIFGQANLQLTQQLSESSQNSKQLNSPSEQKFGAKEVEKNVYVGGIIDTSVNDQEMLKKYGFGRVLNVAHDCEEVASDLLIYKKYHFRDCPGDAELIENNLEDCIEFIEEGIKQNEKVLIHCFAGLSRSVTIAIGYMMKKKADELKQKENDGIDIEKSEYNLYCNALHKIQKIRNEEARPGNINFTMILLDYEKKLLSKNNNMNSDIIKNNNSDEKKFVPNITTNLYNSLQTINQTIEQETEPYKET